VPSWTCEVSYVSMLETVSDTFVTTVLSADSLTASKVAGSWQVLVTMGCLIAGIFIAMGLSYQADKKVQKQVDVESNMIMQALTFKNKEGRSRRSFLEQKKQTIYQNDISSSSTNISILKLAEEALPNIMKNDALLQRIWNEIKRHHRWIGVIYYFSPTFPRVLRVLSLATNIIIMLFVQSLTYAFTKGDDGTCSIYRSQEACLQDKSIYQTGEAMCSWIAAGNAGEDGGSCEYVQPANSIIVVLFVAVFSAITSTPIVLLVDWIIQKILAAPVQLSEQRKKKQKVLINEALISVVPVTSSSSITAASPIANSGSSHHPTNLNEAKSKWLSLEEDILKIKEIEETVKKEFIALTHEIQYYRTCLTNPNDLKEFDCKLCFPSSFPSHFSSPLI
jgi:hypothetical protein